MEAVPRLPMCSFELKISPSNTEFGPSIKKYIAEFYHEEPDSYNKELKEIEKLRQSACKAPKDYTGCRILKQYFAQLHCLEKRFPMSEGGAACVPFMWSDIYSGMVFNITDIRYEQACILYNVGALHSELGASDFRTNSDGMKVAYTHFQCAAWAFQHLRDNYPQLKGSDMAHDLLTYFTTLTLAQAQECILEKSMLDSRKSAITAKVAAQVVEFYRSALATLVAGSSTSESGCILEIVGSKLFKHWKKVLEFKIAYYTSIAHLYMGNQAEEQQLMGERVAWYNSALEKHGEASKIAKSIDREDLNEALTFTLDVIAGKCTAAKKENDFVYHEKVVPTDSLPEIKGASLVKGVPFSVTDPDVCGPDIFARLVPMEAHEASSIYSEEKAKLWRDLASRIDDRNQELIAFMSSLQLDRNSLFPKAEKIPQELLEKCAALSVKPNYLQEVQNSLEALTEVYQEVTNSLNECGNFLQREEQQEKIHQDSFGKRSPSLITVELSKEYSKYETAHQRAAESNVTLQKALDIHMNNIKLLGSMDELQKALPSTNIMDSPNEEGTVQELLMLLDKTEEMKKQRHMLENQLRDSIQNDDITKLLVIRDKNDSLQNVFQAQLKKHDSLIGYLDQNLSAQDNILRALTHANARYADTRRNIADIVRRREIMVGNLLASFDAYEDLMLKAQKGLEFYHKLQTNVQRLQARIRSVTSVQEEERLQIAQAQTKKANKIPPVVPVVAPASTGSKLKDYLPYMTGRNIPVAPVPTNFEPVVPMGIRPTPVGSEHNTNFNDSVLASAMGLRDGDDKQWAYKLDKGSASQQNWTSAAAQYYPPTSDPYYYPDYSVPTTNQTYQNYPQAAAITTPATSNVENLPAAMYQNYSTPTTLASSTSGAYQNYSTAGQIPTNAESLYQNYSTTIAPSTGAYQNYSTPAAVPSTASGTYQNYPGIVTTTAPSSGTYQNYSSTAAAPSTAPGTYQNYSPASQIPTNVENPYQNYSEIATTSAPSTGTYQNYSAPSTASVTYQNYSGTSTTTTPSTETYQNYSAATATNQNYATPISSTESNYPTTFQNYYSTAGSSNVPSSTDYSQQVQTTQYQPYNQPTYDPNQSQTPIQPKTENYAASYSPAYMTGNYYIGANQPVDQVNEYPNQDYNSEANYQPQQQQYTNYQPQSSYQADFNGMLPLQPTIIQPVKVEPPKVEPVVVPSPAPTPPPPKVEYASSSSSVSSRRSSVTSSPAKQSLANDLKDISTAKVEQVEENPLYTKDPLLDATVLERFTVEVDKFKKLVEGLAKKSLNGPTPLDQKWKEITDSQDKESRKLSISVARCYPLKNRVPDIMPYDSNRVELQSVRNDYINASYVTDLVPNYPKYIVTQAPMSSSFVDFWVMVWEQQVELVVCIVNAAELKGQLYWPTERAQPVTYGSHTLSLQSSKECQFYTESMISLTHNESKLSRVVIHLQFVGWPPGGIPTNPSLFLQFIGEVHNYHKQQRNLQRPIVIHCLSGVGRSGVYCLLSAAMKELALGRNPPDLGLLATKASHQRKFIILEKEQLKFSYEAALYHAQDILVKRGILSNKTTFDEIPSTRTHTRHPSQDFILGGLTPKVEIEAVSQSTNTPEPEELTKAMEQVTISSVVQTPAIQPPQPVKKDNVSSILDPANFTLEPATGKKKFSKESFVKPAGLSQQPNNVADPLSQLDPLWSLKK